MNLLSPRLSDIEADVARRDMSSSNPSTLPFVGSALEGVGIHTGKRFRVRLVAAGHQEFLRFVAIRTGSDVLFEAPALWSRLSGTARATALVLRATRSIRGRGSRLELKTIEHFLAAYHVMGLRGYDLYIEALDVMQEDEAFEMPILEGSSLQWLSWLHGCLGPESMLFRSQDRPVWKVIRSLEIRDGERKVLILPNESAGDASTHLYCSVSFLSKWAQQMSFDLDWRRVPHSVQAFRERIAPARTFGFEHELKELEARGLAVGGTLSNALLLNHERVINEGGFCVPEELAAHKLLDAIGDFALLGAPLLGRIELQCAGHAIHLRAVSEAARKGALVRGVLDRNGQFHRDEL